MKRTIVWLVLSLVSMLVGCAAGVEDERVGEVQQGLHYGIWRFNPDEDAMPNTFFPYPSVSPGQRWTLVDDWRITTGVSPSQTFDDGFLWFSGNSCGFNCSGEVYEPAVGIASNPSLYNAIVSIDHVDIYFAFSNSTGRTVTVWMNVLDEKWTGLAGPGTYLAHGTMYSHNYGPAYTKQDFADPHVDGIYFGVGAESTPIGPSGGSIAIGAVRLEVVYATP